MEIDERLEIDARRTLRDADSWSLFGKEIHAPSYISAEDVLELIEIYRETKELLDAYEDDWEYRHMRPSRGRRNDAI